MHMFSLSAEIFAAVLIAVFPLMGPYERQLYRSESPPMRKLAIYGATAILLWTLAAVALQIEGWDALRVPPAAGEAWLPAPTITGAVLVIAVAAYLVVALLPLIQSLRGQRWRQAYAKAIRHSYSDIPGLLPNTATERFGWILVSLSAGVCEEILFRGFLIRFLHDGRFGLPLAGALAVSALIFGLAHAYQGLKGVVTTGLGGLSFGLLFLLSGHLIPGIVLHALLDLQLAYVLCPLPVSMTGTQDASPTDSGA